MTSIYCSYKLQKLIGNDLIGANEDSKGTGFGDWFAHYTSFKRKKCLFIIHIPTYYTVVLADVKKNDIVQLKSDFALVLKSRLQNDKIFTPDSQVNIENLIGHISFMKSNNDKKTISTLNQRILEFEILFDWHKLSFRERDILYINALINQSICKSRSGKRREYIDPIEEMNEKINSLSQ